MRKHKKTKLVLIAFVIMTILLGTILITTTARPPKLYEKFTYDSGYAGVYGKTVWGQQFKIGTTGEYKNFRLRGITIKACRDVEALPDWSYLEVWELDDEGKPAIFKSVGAFNADELTTDSAPYGSAGEVYVPMLRTRLKKKCDYAILLKVPYGDGYNKIKWRCNVRSEEEPWLYLYEGGSAIRSTDGGKTWTIREDVSFYFKVYG